MLRGNGVDQRRSLETESTTSLKLQRQTGDQAIQDELERIFVLCSLISNLCNFSEVAVSVSKLRLTRENNKPAVRYKGLFYEASSRDNSLLATSDQSIRNSTMNP